MRFFSYVLRSINLLNVLLAAAVVLLATYALFPLASMKVTVKPPALEQAAVAQEEKPAVGQSPSPSEFVVVAEQNLFHPERMIPPEKASESLTKPDIILYGTLVTDDMRLAYIEDRKSPQTSPGRGVRQSVVKQGQTVGGFLLKSVEADRIVLVRGDEQMIVYLADTRKQRAPATQPQPGAPAQPGARSSTPATPAPMQRAPRPGTPAPAGQQAITPPASTAGSQQIPAGSK